MKPIKTIQNLIEAMNDTESQQHPKLLQHLNIPIEVFEPCATWDEGGYTRNCLARTDDYELILICWAPGAKTSVHNHNDQHCWMYQISGDLKEQRFAKPDGQLNMTRESELKQGEFTYMHDRMGFHQLQNPAETKAMSLHIYVAPIEQCQVYNPENGTLETKVLSYDTLENATV